MLVDLRPPFLAESGLSPALRHELERLHPRGAHIGLQDFTGGMRWDPHIEYGVFMIGREEMLNAIQHAQASTITPLVRWTDAMLTVTVQDDGLGIAHELRSERPGHLGITEIQSPSEERVIDTRSVLERQVVRLVVKGLSSAAIGAALHLSPKTVDSYRSPLMSKLQVSSLPALVRLAVREGFISLDD